MSAAIPLVIRSFRVGKRTCTLTIPRSTDGGMLSAVAEWAPTAPVRLSAKEWEQYRTGRNQVLAGVAAELGLPIAVLEL